LFFIGFTKEFLERTTMGYGLLVFVWKGKYYCILNEHRSHSSEMGLSVLKQISTLLNQFRGNVRFACDHWGNLIEKLTFVCRSNLDYDKKHPFNKDNGFENIEQNLMNDTSEIESAQKLNLSFVDLEHYCAGAVFVLEWIWKIHLDTCEFEVNNCTKNFNAIFIEIPFKSIYKNLLSSDTRAQNELFWLKEVESLEYNRETKTASWKPLFVWISKIITTQANIRRFLTQRRMLEPGTGLLYILAKIRFEHQI
jgi:hypothetical protein